MKTLIIILAVFLFTSTSFAHRQADSATTVWIDSFFKQKELSLIARSIGDEKRWIRGLETYRVERSLDPSSGTYKSYATCAEDGTLVPPGKTGSFESFGEPVILSNAERQKLLAEARLQLSELRNRYRALND